MVSKAFRLATFNNNVQSGGVLAPGVLGAASTVYDTIDLLPLTGNQVGDLAYVDSDNRFYVNNGTGWYLIASSNQGVTITVDGNASYELSSDGTPTVITLAATDPEGFPITWSYVVSSGSLEDTTVTNNGGEFTITPGETAATFNLTFTASDGINIDTSTSSFTLSFGWAKAATNYGYVSGGRRNTPNFQLYSGIDKFPFAADTISTLIGSLAASVAESMPSNSSTHGYTAGGHGTPGIAINTIQKFSFSSEGAGSSIGTLTGLFRYGYGHSSSTHGYSSGGFQQPANQIRNYILSYPFAADANATQVGTIVTAVRYGSHTSIDDYGYVFAGEGPAGRIDTVQKFPFAAGSVSGSNVGSLSAVRAYQTAMTTQDYAYNAGGGNPSLTDSVEKYVYSSNTSLGNVGNLSVLKWGTGSTGISGVTNGYIAGSQPPTPAPELLKVEKFPFASETAAASFGDLSASVYTNITNQYLFSSKLVKNKLYKYE